MTAAKAALEAFPSLEEPHEGACTWFAVIAAQRARLPVVNDTQ